MHDFADKLRQPGAIEHLRDYVRAQQRARRTGSVDVADVAGRAPLSVNLDLTTACNYACDHCVDKSILNLGRRLDEDSLARSLATLADGGLQSVILIGGGEPTIHPWFAPVVHRIKDLGLQLGLVTNGSRLDKVIEVVGRLDHRDWIRTSLDAATDPTFQAMHRPRRPITLDAICDRVADIARTNPAVRTGFSFIVTWPGCVTDGVDIVANLDEMEAAAVLAKSHGFDYITFKPFLNRMPDNEAERIGSLADGSAVLDRIRVNLGRAQEHADEGFGVVGSTNLRVLLDGSQDRYTHQPANCHMAFFRQVLSPLGVFSCPVYRDVPAARVGDATAFVDVDELARSVRRTMDVVSSFDASVECRDVTCLYNDANWFVEGLISDPERFEELEPSPERHDYFL